MTALVRHEPKEARDAQIGSGIESGLQHSPDRVDALLASELESA